MIENLLNAVFRSHVPKGGYKIVESDAFVSFSDYRRHYVLSSTVPKCPYAIRFVVEVAPDRESEGSRSEDIPSGLLMNMAQTPRTEPGILGFLNRYGPLYPSPNVIAPVDAEGRPIAEGDRLIDWQQATAYGVLVHQFFELSVAVGLWDMVRHSRLAELQRVFVVETAGDGLEQDDEPRIVFRAGDAFGEVPPRGPEVSERFVGYQGSLVSYPVDMGPVSSFSGKPGRAEVRAAVGLIHTLAEDHLRHGVTLGLKPQGKTLGLSLTLRPTTLLGAIWLQLALAITRQTEFRECPACGAWFEISPSVARTDKVFCSAACRSRTHKRKRGEVLRMHAAGMVLSEIAEEVEVPVDTAQRWIAKEGAADAKEARP